LSAPRHRRILRFNERSKPRQQVRGAFKLKATKEVRMSQEGDAPVHHDYSCETIGAIALLILSALSHFWYIAIALSFFIVLWAAVQFAAKMVHAATEARVRVRVAHVEPLSEPAAAFGAVAISGSGISAVENTPERGLLEI
jgi:hypothetical protein